MGGEQSDEGCASHERKEGRAWHERGKEREVPGTSYQGKREVPGTSYHGMDSEECEVYAVCGIWVEWHLGDGKAKSAWHEWQARVVA